MNAAPEIEDTQVGTFMPLLLTVEQAAKRLGIGRTKLYELVMSGEVESIPIGRLRKIPAECLDEYVWRLRSQSRHINSAA